MQGAFFNCAMYVNKQLTLKKKCALNKSAFSIKITATYTHNNKTSAFTYTSYWIYGGYCDITRMHRVCMCNCMIVNAISREFSDDRICVFYVQFIQRWNCVICVYGSKKTHSSGRVYALRADVLIRIEWNHPKNATQKANHYFNVE